jgi:hypothetical protein
MTSQYRCFLIVNGSFSWIFFIFAQQLKTVGDSAGKAKWQLTICQGVSATI